MTTSVIPQVIDYMVAQAGASSSLGLASPAVVVIDGPHLTDDTLAQPMHLWIGHDPYADGQEAASADQDFAGLDMGLKRNETGQVTCTAEAWAGGDVIKTQRDTTAGIVAAVELLLRGTPRSGGPGDTSMGGLVLWSQVSGPFSWYQKATQDGLSVGCVFRITYQARLVTS